MQFLVSLVMALLVCWATSSIAHNPDAMEPGTRFKDCPDCPEMVVIPPGHFVMGSTDADNEQPVHPVAINYSFAIGVFEITIGEFLYLGTGPKIT